MNYGIKRHRRLGSAIMITCGASRSIFLGPAIAGIVATMGATPAVASASDEAAFRALYRELVEINTTRSVGSCTAAAEAMRAHLLAAGIPAADAQILAPP